MKIIANTIKSGNILEFKGKLYQVIKQPEHTMPGKGGAFVQVEMKELKSGTKLNERFRSTEDVERVRLDAKEYQYLFMDDNLITLMDVENYEQVEIGKEVFADKIDLLQDGMIITVESYEEQPINIILPESINLEVVEAEPVIKGQTATASFKPAIMANGLRIMVPPFINVGDLITIRTADRTYLERAKV